MKQVSLFATITLGALTAFGPFITDFYLPAMPELVHYFQTSPAAVSSSHTASMPGLAKAQILIINTCAFILQLRNEPRLFFSSSPPRKQLPQQRR